MMQLDEKGSQSAWARRDNLAYSSGMQMICAEQALSPWALSAGASGVNPKILVAFTEWLKIGDSASLQGANLAQHPLVAAALDGLASESAFDEAVDATVELVYSTSSGGQPEPAMLPLVGLVVHSVSTRPLAHAPIACHLLTLPVSMVTEAIDQHAN